MNPPRVPRVWGTERVEFVKHFALTPEDHIKLSLENRQFISLPMLAGIVAFVALFISLIATYELWQSGETAQFFLQNAVVLVVALACAALLLHPLRMALRWWTARALRAAGRVDDPITMVANENGLDVVWHGQRNHCPWPSFHAIEEDEGTFYFWITVTVGYGLPARVFDSPDEQNAFREHLTRWAGAAPVSPPILARMGDLARDRLLKETRLHDEQTRSHA